MWKRPSSIRTPATGIAGQGRLKSARFSNAIRLIQGLVRIPFRLDALCYTWDGFSSQAVPEAVTAVYQAIEQRLWKKDVIKLEKRDQYYVQHAGPKEINGHVKGWRIRLLEVVAFAGLYHDVIGFMPKHLGGIPEQYHSC